MNGMFEMFDWILISLGAIIVLPILAFLCVKHGTAGFYKGKEVFRREEEYIDSVQNSDEDENEI